MALVVRWGPAVEARKRWGKRRLYREIEFVCVNPCVPSATRRGDQDALFERLGQWDDILAYRQEFTEMGCEQISLAVIILSDNPVKAKAYEEGVVADARDYGVEVDVVNLRDDEFINDIISGRLEYYKDSVYTGDLAKLVTTVT